MPAPSRATSVKDGTRRSSRWWDTGSPASHGVEPSRYEAGKDQEDKGQNDEREGGAPRPFLGAGEGLGGVAEDLQGQGRVRAAEGVPVGRRGRPHGEQQRGRLAGG